MKEILDIRANNDWAEREYGDSLGEPLWVVSKATYESCNAELKQQLRPITRRIEIDVLDPRFEELKDNLFRGAPPGIGHYSALLVNRRYSRREVVMADCLRLLLTRMFEPCGEDMGTEYDDSQACPKCGYGRVQRSPLRLNLNKVPKRVDIAFTIARNETIISERLAELMARRRVSPADEFSGFRLAPVEHRGRKPPPQKWYQLIVTGNAGPTAPPTRFGIDYLRNDVNGEYTCPQHGLSGLNLVSEVSLYRDQVESVDMAQTTNRQGLFGGVLMPVPIVVITPRFFRFLEEHQVKGYKVEVAHLVD